MPKFSFENKKGGYVGLLVLIISCAIIAVIFWRNNNFSDIFSARNNGKNIIEQDNGYIDSANQAKNILEAQSRNQASGMNEGN